MIKAGIYGASGYTGVELVRLLHAHPRVELTFITGDRHAGATLDTLYSTAPALPLRAADEVDPASVDVVFLALPHAASATVAAAALQAGATVLDLSADFRLRAVAEYEQWYHTQHPAPALLAEAVYGLTELARADLPAARLVACPGCYPTSVLLALWPLATHGGLTPGATVIADSKSGASGAGRGLKQHLHFVELSDNFFPYSIGQAHRHQPEIAQQIGRWVEGINVIFSPHLLPVPRGIVSTVYAPLPPGWDDAHLRAVYSAHYADEPFVTVLPAGQLPSLAHVVRTNRCVIGLTVAGGMAIITSALDNLIKGAGGQAVQNLNVIQGWPETTGLT